MYAILSLSTAELSVRLRDSDKEFLETKPLDEVMKEEQEKEEQEKEENAGKDNTNDLVDGGKVNVKEYNTKSKSQDLSDRLIDPLDGGEPNYRSRGTSSNIRDDIRIKPLSHNPRNSHER